MFRAGSSSSLRRTPQCCYAANDFAHGPDNSGVPSKSVFLSEDYLIALSVLVLLLIIVYSSIYQNLLPLSVKDVSPLFEASLCVEHKFDLVVLWCEFLIQNWLL